MHLISKIELFFYRAVNRAEQSSKLCKRTIQFLKLNSNLKFGYYKNHKDVIIYINFTGFVVLRARDITDA